MDSRPIPYEIHLRPKAQDNKCYNIIVVVVALAIAVVVVANALGVLAGLNSDEPDAENTSLLSRDESRMTIENWGDATLSVSEC